MNGRVFGGGGVEGVVGGELIVILFQLDSYFYYYPIFNYHATVKYSKLFKVNVK